MAPAVSQPAKMAADSRTSKTCRSPQVESDSALEYGANLATGAEEGAFAGFWGTTAAVVGGCRPEGGGEVGAAAGGAAGPENGATMAGEAEGSEGAAVGVAATGLRTGRVMTWQV